MHWINLSYMTAPLALGVLSLINLILFFVRYEYIQRFVLWVIVVCILWIGYRIWFVEPIYIFYKLLILAELIYTLIVLIYLLANTSLVNNKDVFLFSLLILLFQTILSFGFGNHAIILLGISMLVLWFFFGVYIFVRDTFDEAQDKWLMIVSWLVGVIFILIGVYGLLENFAFNLYTPLWDIQISANGISVLITLLGCVTLVGSPPFGTWLLNAIYTKKMYFIPYCMFQMLRLGIFTFMAYLVFRLGVYDQSFIYYGFTGIGLYLIIVYGIHIFYAQLLSTFLRDLDMLFMAFLWISLGIGNVESMVFFYSYAFLGVLAFIMIFLFFRTLTIDGKYLLYIKDFTQVLKSISFRNIAFVIAIFSLICFIPTISFWALWAFIINMIQIHLFPLLVIFLIGMLLITSQLFMLIFRMLTSKHSVQYNTQDDFSIRLLFVGYIIFSIVLFFNVHHFFNIISRVIYELKGF